MYQIHFQSDFWFVRCMDGESHTDGPTGLDFLFFLPGAVSQSEPSQVNA